MEHAKAGKGLKGATRLLQGAPGAGKTAILFRLEQLWDERGKAAPIAVRVDVEDLEATSEVIAAIAEAVSSSASDEWRKTEHRQTSGSVGTSGTRIGGLRGYSIIPGKSSFAALKRLLPPEKWPRPVVLMADEIQKARDGVGHVMKSLHLATYGLPIVPLYAGLGNSREILDRIGLSRLDGDGVHSIGCLSQD